MGDPRKLRNKFERPKKLWDVDRIKEEKALKNEYGLANMSELWRATAELKKYRREARRLLSLTEEERRDDAVKILQKLARLGILKEGAVLDDVLSLDVRVVLERRLQTMVLRKGLARTASQARQLITHGFIALNGRKVSRPGFMVLLEDEGALSYTKPIDISVPDEEDEENAGSTTGLFRAFERVGYNIDKFLAKDPEKRARVAAMRYEKLEHKKRVLMEKGKYVAALADLDQAIKMDSKNILSYMLREELYNARGDAEKAAMDAAMVEKLKKDEE